MENRVDSCCCGVADMVEDSLGVQSYSVYHYRRSGGYIWLVRQEKNLSVRQIDKEEKEDGV